MRRITAPGVEPTGDPAMKVPAMKIAALVPAAGASRRMGRDKRRLPLGEHTVLEQTVAVLRRAGLSPIVVVLERDSPCRALPGLSDAIFVENPRPERGMLSSIRVGLAALPDAVEAVAVQPGDHPFVPVGAIEALAEHCRRERPRLLVPRYPDRRGHPLIIARALFAEAAACDDAVGLRQLLELHRDDLHVLGFLALSGADADLDTPQDYARLVGTKKEPAY